MAKPAELTPLSAFVVGVAADAIGLPPGVLNIVPGPGGDVGEASSTHPGVEVVSFSVSTRVGRQVAALAAGIVKRVCLDDGATLVTGDVLEIKAVQMPLRTGRPE